MGIAGAGVSASSLAEIAAFVFFLIYILLDKDLRPFDLFTIPHIEPSELRNIYKLSLPILMQSVIGIASWFIFFSFIEKLGERLWQFPICCAWFT